MMGEAGITLAQMMDVAGKRVVVMGLGRFGGGLGVTRWLAERGADVLVTDLEPVERLAGSVEGLRDLTDRGVVALRLGEHAVSDFTGADLIVANPAVPRPWENPYLCAAEGAGVPITTEIGLTIGSLGEEARSRTIGITGSVGKSTTTAMIHAALSQAPSPPHSLAPDIRLGGNIGGSLLADQRPITERTRVILELSSFQLYWLERSPPFVGGWSPHVALVTNIAPNHLDWHGDFDHYQQSKRFLLAHQRPGDYALLGRSVESWSSGTPGTPVFPDRSAWEGALLLPGAHNRLNASAALAACRACDPETDPAVFIRAIAEYPGLPHRLQLVAQRTLPAGGAPVRFYNDSKSTTPEAALTALEALATMPGSSWERIHLIAGGYDKGADLSPIAVLAERLGGLYTIGATGAAIAASVPHAARARCLECGTLDRAVEAATNRLQPGDCLLLSPGCASWDQFVNFEARGEMFLRLVGSTG